MSTWWAGVIERNGNFWMENFPLAPGTNWLILTATDINNNVTNLSIAVVQSGVMLTVTPSSDVSWQTTMDVSGTINRTGYNVWVNGLEPHKNSRAESRRAQRNRKPLAARDVFMVKIANLFA